ncbi:MAG TPA: AAA family ATPase [Bryobacteraceae bacterium]|nr:AAA family ATPase [Bryobacteraceae bacterium]
MNPLRIESMLQEMIHVPGLRGNPERAYPVTGTGPLYPGTFENYTASVILRWQKDKLSNDVELISDLQKIHMARSVFAHRISDVAIELRVGMLRERAHNLDNIADVGFGVSQVLPVVVALRAADEGRLVYLEEPEIHLHPLAQTKLAEVLANAAKRGVRVVAETHSSLLLTGIQTLVAKGELPAEIVKLHWVQRDARTGISRVCSADLDENGAFGNWPEDFDDVTLSADRQYMDAVTARSSG